LPPFLFRNHRFRILSTILFFPYCL